jgi:DNA-binding CsgD family transcriptional regulator
VLCQRSAAGHDGGVTRPAARRELARLTHDGLALPEFFTAADDVLRRAIGYDGACWFSMDPATHLPTSHIGIDSIRPEDVPRLANNEYREVDVNKFIELAPAARIGVLGDATGGEPSRSARYREILRPNGFGHELRVALVRNGECWGGMAAYRALDRTDFSPAEVCEVAAMQGYLTEGIRRALLVGAIASGGPTAPGLVLLDERDRVVSINAAGHRWLDELLTVPRPAPGRLPDVAYALAASARQSGDEVALTRVPTAARGWALLHATMVHGEPPAALALIVEAARPAALAEAIAAGYGLTERERDIAGLVLRGKRTREIAQHLFLSEHTVHDYLKVIYAKVGVRSRAELTAQVFFEHYAPRLADGTNVSADGWFRG